MANGRGGIGYYPGIGTDQNSALRADLGRAGVGAVVLTAVSNLGIFK